MKKIICAHLYNDFSGSPLVLSTVIKGFKNEGLNVEIITSTESQGFLSELDVEYQNNGYKFWENKYLRLIMFLICQVKMFYQTFRYRNEDVVIYVNTLLPFGVAIAGKLMGKKVVYHMHETSLNPLILKNFLKWIASKTASEAIYVSEFLSKKEGLNNVSSNVIYNTLSDDFIKTAKAFKKLKSTKNDFVILMLCSLKSYKGVNEYVALAKTLPDFTFDLVLNATESEIEVFFSGKELPQNLNLYPKQSNVHRFFQKADLVLNLSHPEQWVETFGMTLLEGMQYGLPTIAPPVGGPTEIVFPKVNGYLIDQRHQDELAQQIKKIATDKKLYHNLSRNAKEIVQQFTMEKMGGKLLEVVN